MYSGSTLLLFSIDIITLKISTEYWSCSRMTAGVGAAAVAVVDDIFRQELKEMRKKPKKINFFEVI